jgi:hypothetical protein
MAPFKPFLIFAMFALTNNSDYAAVSVRPVNKATDRPVVREIFRREFYGDNRLSYPDDGLWEIYDRMEIAGAFGAYLVCRGEQVLFLLEIHPPIQMDLTPDHFTGPGAIGIYCFTWSRDETIYYPAFRACIASLFAEPAITRILTSLGQASGYDPKARLLEKTGFTRQPETSGRSTVYCCTRESFHEDRVLSTDILFAMPSALTQ